MKARIFMLIGLVFILIPTLRVQAQSPGSLFDNIALSTQGATATAISEGEFPSGNFQYAYLANDGDPNTSWSSQWDMPAWLEVEFDQVQNIVAIGVVWASHQHTFSVSLSLDGSTWTTVVSSRLSNSEEGLSGVYELFSILSTDAKYMRIDITSTSAPTSHIFQSSVGELQAFTVIYPNTALSTEGATATAISEGEFPSGNFQYAYLANDGDPYTSWSSQWDMPAWLEVEFNQTQKIGMIGIVWASHQHTFSVSLSLDGSSWTTVVSSRLSNSEEGLSGVYELFSILSTDAKYMRIDITSTSAPTSHIFQASVGELQAFPIIPISVEDDMTVIPFEYFLNQNYPNPFNPVTVIGYTLPKVSEVSLVIYDIIGEEVIILYSGVQIAGDHEISWDASKQASGIYFYRLQAGEFVQSKKMVLLK